MHIHSPKPKLEQPAHMGLRFRGYDPHIIEDQTETNMKIEWKLGLIGIYELLSELLVSS